jgi:hypothetical protein
MSQAATWFPPLPASCQPRWATIWPYVRRPERLLKTRPRFDRGTRGDNLTLHLFLMRRWPASRCMSCKKLGVHQLSDGHQRDRENLRTPETESIRPTLTFALICLKGAVTNPSECSPDERQRNPGLADRIALRFVLGEKLSGEVSTIRIRRAEACLRMVRRPIVDPCNEDPDFADAHPGYIQNAC